MSENTMVPEARSIGERIKKARKSAGLSQADLATRIGVSQPAIANWESGIHDPRRLMLAKLADILETPLDWLAAGDRSVVETDKQAAAAYLRRPVLHVPILQAKSAALLALDPAADVHALAEDYIPVTSGATYLFAMFISDPAVNKAFPPDTLVVVDYGDRRPADGDFCLALIDGAPTLRRWRDDPQRLEPFSFEQGHEIIIVRGGITIVGCVRVSIHVH